MAAEEALSTVAGDVRLDYLGSLLQNLLRISEEKWLKLVQTEESRLRITTRFFDCPESEAVFLSECGSGGSLVVSHSAESLPSSRHQLKLIYLIKGLGVVVTPENVKDVIVCGDVSTLTVEHLQGFLDYALVPILCNPSCHDGWTRELAADLLGSVTSFRGVVARAVAQSRGHVIIAVPPLQPFETTVCARSESGLLDAKASWIRDTVSVLESSVQQWSEQIREVLERKLEGGAQQHPEPAHHYKFWRRRGKTLRFIQDQLRSEALNVVSEILQTAKSPCNDQLLGLIQTVEEGVKEAEDIEMHLVSLHTRCKDLEAKDLPRLRHHLVDGLFRMVKEAVDHCTFLQQSRNMTVVSQIYSSIANILVHLSQQFLHGATLFRGELDDSEQKLDLVLVIMDHVRRSRISNDSFAALDQKDRLEMFVKRLKSIKVVFETSSAFLRLIKTEIGGIQGHVTACQIRKIYHEFQEQLVVFDKCPYDILEPDSEEFEKDIERFRRRIADLDERLGSIIKACVLSCSNAEAMSKVLQVCEFLLQRPAIRSVAAATCEKHMLERAKCEMDSLLMKFLAESKRQKASLLPVNLSLPKTSRIIQWVTDIKELLSHTEKSIYNVSHLFISKTVIEGLSLKHDKLSSTFTKLADETFDMWAEDIPQLLRQKLHQALIMRPNGDRRIAENFSSELENLIHEVKHLLRLKNEKDLPTAAVAFYRDRDRLGDQRVMLKAIIERYNDLQEDLLPVETALLLPALRQMDKLLSPGESSVLWSEPDRVSEYLQEVATLSESIHYKVQTSKSNLRKIQSVCGRWACSEPMLESTHLPVDLSALKSAQPLVAEKLHRKVRQDASKIQALIKENQKLFGVTDSAHNWKKYISFIDELVSNGILALVQQNLQFFLQPSHSREKPIFMIHVLCDDSTGLYYKPPLFKPDGASLHGLVAEIVDGIFDVGVLFPRIDTNHVLRDYLTEFQDYQELERMRDELKSRVDASTREAEEILLDLQSFSYLWRDDPESIVRNLTPSVDNSLGTIPQIIEQIRHCRILRNQVSENVRLFRLVNGWLRVDQLRFLNHLLSRVDSWKARYQEMVLEGVNHCIQELDEFCSSSESELKDIPSSDQMDSVTLLKIITRIQAVQDRRTNTDEVFGSLSICVKFLSNDCNMTLEESTLLLLQRLPDKWTHTKKLAEVWRQQISTPMAIEASCVRKEVSAFSVKQIQFREQFRKSSAFRRDCPQPPENMLNQLREGIADLHKEVLELTKSGKLFEVHVPEFSQLKQCENELELLQELWNYIAKVKIQLQVWEDTPWTKVDLDALEMQCKVYMRDIKSMDREMRSWDNFLWLQETIKNILVALRAIHQLRNPAIKDRHWTQLSKATEVPLSVDESTPLGELLSLELHRFEDVVEGIVERASKELATERTLAELEATWSTILFEKAPHPRTGHDLLHISDALVSTLEDNQVQLQNLMSSRHVAHFADRISEWARRLSRVESVVGSWVEVQRAWAQMESIFLGSKDIKNQLPDDCERFMSIDESFKKLVNVLSAESETVVSVSDRDDVHNDLEHLQKELALCEKALASYLETKRRIFPRFYFVSSADLLDILSNGTRPKIIVRHLPKLFDSVGQLKFVNNNEELAEAVISRDGECLPLKDHCSCLGAVESWLGRLLTAIGGTLRESLAMALSTYEDGNRENWIFENAAQVALTGTQIWWAAEVSAALQRVRQGHEIALKQYHKKQMQQLHHLIGLLLTELTPECRQKVMTICTMDVHARDVVARLVAQKVENESDFAWQSQLRHRWEDEDCRVHICDAHFDYSHEYLGNTSRLVVTPLTDRCFITLTQSLKLMIGGAPTGPAGTGKTETVKDLGRALGTLVYVFNCSEQMDYRSCANIYKGLAQTGAWGCFDEFNRISVEVLSVVAVQVKCVQDALRAHKPSLCLLGDDVPLKSTLGIFITMNPGYAGRSELPENLKTLFRPCAMVAPDSQLICEILLVAEGFVEARSLGQKFTTLYSLCRQLLSPQHHYDWGLRAIKSVLVVAGSLKRASPASPEEHILMLALRDFNLPKIVSEDVGVFLGLIGDLFPALDVPRKKNLVLEKSVREAISELKLQPEDIFVLKVLQLSDMLGVRHSVFLVGAAGSGKSSVMKTLLEVHRKEKPLSFHLNPKVVTNDELFGTINPATREWKDGLLSSLIRDLVNASTSGPRWLILDGDIDPMWIESMNSVMDDNRILTLASRERISLTPTMRLLFEVSTLERATPATVSRGGVLYLDPADVGWNPFAVSWIERRDVQSEKANLIIFFDKYVPPCLDALNKRFKTTLQVPDICYVQTLCRLLECLLTPENTPPESPNELYELYFVFCCVWAFGSALEVSSQLDIRLEFSNWFLSEFKSVKFPISATQAGGEVQTVFDYYIENRRFYPWTRKLQKFQPSSDISLQNTLVPTKETHRIQYLLNLLIQQGHPVMLVGPGGCGKTSVVRSTFTSLDQDTIFLVVNVPFSFYTTSSAIQRVMEMHLEKKVGKNYGPPGQKRIVFFIDDFNIPEVDVYGTCQPHTIIRQHMDYGQWYDRNKLTLKEVTNCQYVACMCPTAGSCTINSRLQRHFCIISVPPSSVDSMQNIFGVQLKEHLRRIHPDDEGEFRPSLQQQIVKLAVALQERIAIAFRPTATKFHYLFNLRDIANVFRGLMLSSAESLTKGEDLLQLWLHESQRVYRDKLLDHDDLEKFDKIISDVLKRNTEMDDSTAQSMVAGIPIHCHFAQGIGTACYQPVHDHLQLARLIQDGLDAYNDIYPPMDLVLFEDAVRHVCRITRILESGGHALLIGVGGSGRQSLASLAAYICNLHLHQPTLHQDYDLQDFKNDIGGLYLRAGVKNIGSLFLISDAQVVDERFLVLVNDLLSSGDIPDLFPEAEVENIVSALRSEVKSAGIFDSRDNCWNFFINKVKRRLRVVLCFSPAGSTLRSRSRKFPTLISCTCIDWFHPWPKDALVTVCNKFLEDLPTLKPELRDSVADFVAFAYRSVNEVSKTYLKKERRHNETTPKSFLQHVKTYKVLMQKRYNFLGANVGRLEAGLQKLVDTSEQVDVLKGQLAEQEIELQQRSTDIDALLTDVERERECVSHERTVAAEEEEKVSRIHSEVAKRQKDCEQDLAGAEPALVAAQEALNTLNKSNLTELRSFGSPPVAVRNVTAAVMVLLATDGKIPKDLSWRAAKLTMSKVDNFLDSLIHFDKNHIHENSIRAIQTYLRSPEFKPEVVLAKSQAAAGLCSWVMNVLKYYEVYCNVEPKRRALAEANAEYQVAKEKLARIQEKVTEVESRLNELQTRCDTATEAKLRCESEAQRTAFSLHLANRLLGGLASERQRWSSLATRFKELERSLAGDVLLASAFVAYLGPFSGPYRRELQYEYWRPFLESKSSLEVGTGTDDSSTLGPIVSLLLEDETIIGRWRNDGLPGDMASVENAAVFETCFLVWRWPLLVDPQVQAMPWLRATYGDKLKIVRTDQKGYLDKIEEAIVNGQVIVIENLEESIDPRLYPIIFHNFVKKGKAIKFGNKEIPFNTDFRLILHTKLSNPKFGPEIQAQTTVINFGVTPEGLAEQLLAEVVSKERPDLEAAKASLTKQQSEFAVTLKQLEESLLSRLSETEGDLVGDVTLVESLEQTKATAAEVQTRDEEARATENEIDQARGVYRDVADRTALVYFVVQDMATLSSMYLFSLKCIKDVFHKAIDRCEPNKDVEARVKRLVEVVTLAIFNYVSRGLFESHKTVLAAHLTFQILRLRENIPIDVSEFLLHQNLEDSTLESPVEFMTAQAWAAIRMLSSLDEFQGLDRDMEASPKRWRKFLDSPFPEKEFLPQEWKNKSTPFHKLCILRCLRPDRVMYAIRDFVSEVLGPEFVGCRPIDLENVLNEWGTCRTPFLFILSAGVDPLHDLEACGIAPKTIQNVSLGQGQETIAEQTMDDAIAAGEWVVLQNIHLAKGWLHRLEKKLEDLQTVPMHKDFRLFLSANPPEEGGQTIPPGVLEACLKVTNEPPKGMRANLHKALDNFSQETFDSSSRDTEFKSLLFTLCYFHAVLTERKKFGSQGWNYPYPFNDSDLIISANVLHNHLDCDGGRASTIPWEDLRFLFGEIMYGGHITDDRDRKICTAYLNKFFNNEQLEADYPLCPGFGMPPILDYEAYHRYVDDHLPNESPVLYGLHPNAEVGCLTDASNNLLRALHLLEPSTATESAQDMPLNNNPNECAVVAASNEEKIRQVAEDITDKLPPLFPLADLQGRITDEGSVSPFAAVGLQECERMNFLLQDIRKSLKDIDRGLKGELPWSEDMEALGDSLASDAVPRLWASRAYPSLLPLGSWFTDLLQRHRALDRWVQGELSVLPPAVWLGGLFSPQSFLTAVIQTSGRKHDQPLDKLALHCEVTKKNPEDCSLPPREGANIAGLYMEGGRWDFSTGCIMDPLMKELHPVMPVVCLRAVLTDKVDIRNAYPCPVYRTRQRGDTFVWEFPLKSSVPPDKWVIAGTALLLQI